MEPSLWQHQAIEPITDPLVRGMALQAFTIGVAVGIILVATIVWWGRPGSTRAPRSRRTALVSGWGDLFRLVAAAVRGVLWLAAVLLLLSRLVFWPAGRRW